MVNLQQPAFLLTVIIPVYNEASTLSAVLAAVRKVPISKEIILVDGNSTDGTRDVLELEKGAGDLRIVLQPAKNGRGGALREGLAIAAGDVIVFQDADLELNPSCFPELLKPIVTGSADIVLGSRFLRGRPDMTLLQYWGNRAVTTVLNILWNTRLTDVETCYQMFRSETVREMKFDRCDMSFTVELTLKLLRGGRRIVEVPVSYTPRTKAEGKKLYWGDGFISLWVLIQYRVRWWIKDLINTGRFMP